MQGATLIAHFVDRRTQRLRALIARAEESSAASVRSGCWRRTTGPLVAACWIRPRLPNWRGIASLVDGSGGSYAPCATGFRRGRGRTAPGVLLGWVSATVASTLLLLPMPLETRAP